MTNRGIIKSRRGTRRTKARRVVPGTEWLEKRDCPAVRFQFDFRYDVQGFFNDPARRSALQRAADTLSSRLNDRLAAIVPTGGNTWTAQFFHPGQGGAISLDNLTVPADTLLVFAGGYDLRGSALGVGGSGGSQANGSASWVTNVRTRGQAGAQATPPTDTAPWGGAIAFDNRVNWFHGSDADGQGAQQHDFISVALHELYHLVGFGASPVWDRLASGTNFQGLVSRLFYDGGSIGPPVTDGHWGPDVTDEGFEAAMTPFIRVGTRKLATRLDYAGLQDLGWEVVTDPDGILSNARPVTLGPSASLTLTGLQLDNATDTDLYRIDLVAGATLTARTLAEPTGVSVNTGLRLFNPQGRELVRADQPGYDTLTYTASTSGTYFLGVAASENRVYSVTESPARVLAGSVGDYRLELSQAGAGGGGGSPPSGPPLIPPGTPSVPTPPPPGPPPVPTPPGPPTTPTPTPTPEPSPSVPPAPPPEAPPPAPSPTNPSSPSGNRDRTPPVVIRARRTPNGRRLIIRFSEAIDPTSTRALSIYRILIGQRAEDGQLVFDQVVTIRRASYDSRARSIVLKVQGRLPRQPIRLELLDGPSWRDLAGNRLDGDRDGRSGGAFIIELA